MHDASCSHALHEGFGLQSSTHEPITTFSPSHGNLTSLWMEEDVMFLLHALTSLNFFLFLVHFLFFLLTKLFTYLHLKATFKNTRDEHLETHRHDGCIHWTEESSEREDVVTDIVGGEEGKLFWFDETVFEDSTLLSDEGKDSSEKPCLQVENTSAKESPCILPPEDHTDATGHGQETKVDVVCVVDVSTSSDHRSLIVTPSEKPPIEEKEANQEANHHDSDHEQKNFSEDHVKFLVNNRPLVDTKKLLLEDVGEVHEDKDKFGASLTSESTSKSSVEWRSSTITKDSETEYPFSSSSRRSSSHWESYTLFRKYDEDMIYFHRVGAQKLTEAESFRSIKYRPRSISERIVHKLTTKPSVQIGLRDPYQDLESAYVAQICLTWEALNWNYNNFRRLNGDKGMEACCCPARVAQEFQQFQVLLQRFIENEPYEYGRRPEVYARMKNSSPKLLLVPEFREEDDEKDDLISATQFLYILEESIRTFMNFLRDDKRSHYQMFKEMIQKRSSSVDQTLVNFLKKANKKKKKRLNDLTRPRQCLKRTKLREEEEMEILVGLIDMKVVSRVLRMPEITEEQLHWCEQKMTKVRVDLDGKIQRDPALLFFPAH